MNPSIILITIATSLMLTTQAAAGVIITGQTTHPGSPNPQTQTVMIDGTRERIESGPQATIIDADRGTIAVLNATTKTYTDSVLKPASTATKAPNPSNPHFEPTGAEQTIAGYKCRIFKASTTTPTGDRTITGCFSTTAPGWKEYQKLNSLLASRSGTNPAELPPGLPLSLETSFKARYQLSPEINPTKRAEMEQVVANRPPIVTTDQVTDIRTASLNPSLFEIPATYKKLRIAGPVEH